MAKNRIQLTSPTYGKTTGLGSSSSKGSTSTKSGTSSKSSTTKSGTSSMGSTPSKSSTSSKGSTSSYVSGKWKDKDLNSKGYRDDVDYSLEIVEAKSEAERNQLRQERQKKIDHQYKASTNTRERTPAS